MVWKVGTVLKCSCSPNPRWQIAREEEEAWFFKMIVTDKGKRTNNASLQKVYKDVTTEGKHYVAVKYVNNCLPSEELQAISVTPASRYIERFGF